MGLWMLLRNESGMRWRALGGTRKSHWRCPTLMCQCVAPSMPQAVCHIIIIFQVWPCWWLSLCRRALVIHKSLLRSKLWWMTVRRMNWDLERGDNGSSWLGNSAPPLPSASAAAGELWILIQSLLCSAQQHTLIQSVGCRRAKQQQAAASCWGWQPTFGPWAGVRGESPASVAITAIPWRSWLWPIVARCQQAISKQYAEWIMYAWNIGQLHNMAIDGRWSANIAQLFRSGQVCSALEILHYVRYVYGRVHALAC